jgi:signal transduction histidine kinase
LITAHGSKQLAIETLNKHFFAFLEKPIKPENLKTVLASALYRKNKEDSEEKLVTLGLNSGELLHELANPLNIVLNKLFLLKREIIKEKYSEKINDYIESIENTIRRTNHIISSSKKAIQGDYELSQFPVSQLAEDVKEGCLQRAVKQGVDLRIEYPVNLKVSGNKNHLLQILVNLINNAIDAVSNLEDRWVQLQVDVRHGYLFFLITDSGWGIAKELQEKIFHPLFTTKRGGGTGFGLFIVDRLVRSYGGRVFLNPDCEHTQFIVQLPQNSMND